MSTVLARFAGRTQCRSLPQAPLALLIQGVLENHGSERAQLAFVQPVVDGLPGELPGALIERLDATRYRLRAPICTAMSARRYLPRCRREPRRSPSGCSGGSSCGWLAVRSGAAGSPRAAADCNSNQRF